MKDPKFKSSEKATLLRNLTKHSQIIYDAWLTALASNPDKALEYCGATLKELIKQVKFLLSEELLRIDFEAMSLISKKSSDSEISDPDVTKSEDEKGSE